MASGLSEFEFRDSFFKKVDEREVEESQGEEEEEEDAEEERDEELLELIEGEDELQDAKAYLSKNKMYDHLAKVLINIFDYRPREAVDIFEALSLEAKKKMSSESDESLSQSEVDTQTTLAQIQKKIFKIPEKEEEAEEEEGQARIGDLIASSYYFEQAGVGLSKEELFKIFLAMKSLIAEKSVEGARFWGKIFGLEQNYIIIEADSGEGEEEDEEEEEEPEDEQQEVVEIEEEGEEEEEIPLPKITYKPPPEVPAEEPGIGANKKVYYVCNDPGKFWTKLPNVTPKEISTAQKITKMFSGRLDAPVISYPPFPGNEINYLRAQIARISAATHISPLDFYMSGESEEEMPGEITKNPEYEPPTMKDLFKMSLGGWVHHVEYILPQGRCSWWNPMGEAEEEEEEEEEEEVTKERTRPVPEVGPPLLTSLSEDNKIHGLAPWTIELPSIVSPNEGIVAVHSNLWVGAHAIFTGESYENIYVGWGVKNSIHGYNPSMPIFLATEYADGPDLVEINDPTVEEEFPKEMDENEEEEEEEEDDEEEELEGDEGGEVGDEEGEGKDEGEDKDTDEN